MTLRVAAAAFALSMSIPQMAISGGHADNVEELFNALALPEMLTIMREEGLDYGAEIGADLFEGPVSADWNDVVSRIYDEDAMRSGIVAALEAELDGADLESMIGFFTSEPGVTIIEYEVAARRALLDDDVEEAAKEVAALAMADETDRYKLVTTFIEANDLVETNIVGALNSNYAFFTGLVDGGGFPAEITEEQILTDVWNQEPDIRQNTTEWVYSFLLLAYEPLEDADLETYIAFSETDAGQDLNAAMFAAFDGMFETISRNLGLASSQFMGRQEL